MSLLQSEVWNCLLNSSTVLCFCTLFSVSTPKHVNLKWSLHLESNHETKKEQQIHYIHCKYFQGFTVGHKETLYFRLFVFNRETQIRVTVTSTIIISISAIKFGQFIFSCNGEWIVKCTVCAPSQPALDCKPYEVTQLFFQQPKSA